MEGEKKHFKRLVIQRLLRFFKWEFTSKSCIFPRYRQIKLAVPLEKSFEETYTMPIRVSSNSFYLERHCRLETMSSHLEDDGNFEEWNIKSLLCLQNEIENIIHV